MPHRSYSCLHFSPQVMVKLRGMVRGNLKILDKISMHLVMELVQSWTNLLPSSPPACLTTVQKNPICKTHFGWLCIQVFTSWMCSLLIESPFLIPRCLSLKPLKNKITKVQTRFIPTRFCRRQFLISKFLWFLD